MIPNLRLTAALLLVSSLGTTLSGCLTRPTNYFKYQPGYNITESDVKGLQFYLRMRSQPLPVGSTLEYKGMTFSTSYQKDVSSGAGRFERSTTTEEKFIRLEAGTPGICTAVLSDEIYIDFGDGVVIPFVKGHVGNDMLHGADGYVAPKRFTSNGVTYESRGEPRAGDFYLEAASTYINTGTTRTSTVSPKGKTIK